MAVQPQVRSRASAVSSHVLHASEEGRRGVSERATAAHAPRVPIYPQALIHPPPLLAWHPPVVRHVVVRNLGQQAGQVAGGVVHPLAGL